MAKIVVREQDGDRVPFLRGILVHSLVSAGLTFSDAYDIAQRVRDSLQDSEEITSAELAGQVAQVLEKFFGPETRRRYEAGSETEREPEIIIRTATREAPFSVGILMRSLEGCAIGKEQALSGARKVQEIIQGSGRKVVDHLVLRRLTHQCLREHSSADAADRYLSWCRFENASEPLILLIGGATATGKSTVSSEVAYRLDIVRTQSTDMMRQIIRCYLAPHVVPTLAYSSFEAWQGLPGPPASTGKRATDNPVIAGFMSQFASVKVALGASIERAVTERHHLIIDGVHVLPTELDLSQASKKAIVVPIMLAALSKKRLEKQLAQRSREQPDRRSSRYLAHVDHIWDLQSYMLDLADKGGIPIIPSTGIESTVREVLNEVGLAIRERYPPRPSQA